LLYAAYRTGWTYKSFETGLMNLIEMVMGWI